MELSCRGVVVCALDLVSETVSDHDDQNVVENMAGMAEVNAIYMTVDMCPSS
jgi:hypothetical protein